MRIDDIDPSQRPRERLLRHGPAALTHAELLALVLRNGSAGRSALAVSHALLRRFGRLDHLASTPTLDLCRIDGIGPAAAAAVTAALHLGREAQQQPEPTHVLGTADLAAIARRHLSHLRRERVLVIACDGANRVRAVLTVADGAADHCLLPVREVLQAVLQHDAVAFGLAHNHPSGSLRPSTADVDRTRRVREAAAVVGVRFLDHVVVTASAWRVVDPDHHRTLAAGTTSTESGGTAATAMLPPRPSALAPRRRGPVDLSCNSNEHRSTATSPG